MNYRRVMVFGAHPDDEIAMAGMIAKLAMKKVKVTVLTFTDGCEGYPLPEMKETIVATRRKESNASDKVLGIHNHIHLEIPDMGLVNNKETLLRCVHAIRKVRPDAIFAHGPMTSTETTSPPMPSLSRLAGRLASRWLRNSVPRGGRPTFTSTARFSGNRPRVSFDVSETEYKRPLAAAKHISQHILWGFSTKDCEEEAKLIKESRRKFVEQFSLADDFILHDFPPR